MFFQLGSIEFKGLLSPHALSTDGDEATYAEHELISGKPRLQKTGDTLQQITIEQKLHIEFCNPTDVIAALKEAKDNGSVLPLLMGDGRFINNYVIISFPYTVDDAFDDGTIKEASVTLTIKEYVSYNPLEQQQLAAKKAAFAVGVKNPIVRRPAQLEGDSKKIARSITAATQQTNKINDFVGDFEHNVSQRSVIANKIVEASQNAQKNLADLQTQLDKAQAIKNKYTAIASSANNVVSTLNAVKNLYPYTSLDALKNANTLLQGATGSFKVASTPFMEKVVTRQPITN